MIKRNRKVKIMIIVTLIVSVVGMSIGFAVFSNVLTISSSATVTPSEDDFKITVYGLLDTSEITSFFVNGNSPDLTKWSTTTSYQFNINAEFGSNEFNATIDNQNLTINNLSANFTGPDEWVMYYFVIKNEGSYDAHVSFSESFINKASENGFSGTCTPGEGATASLVNEACQSILAAPAEINGSNGEVSFDTMLESSYELSINDYIIISFMIKYNSDGSRADGPFTVEFDPIQFDFSTAPKSS